MGISQALCEVRDREFGGVAGKMAMTWGVYQATLSRWLRRDRIPDPSWYGLLAEKLGVTIDRVHRLCMVDRDARSSSNGES